MSAPVDKHAQEPWSMDPEGAEATGIESGNGSHICDVYGDDAGEATARRIVACVNAMQGVADPAAFRAAVAALIEAANAALRREEFKQGADAGNDGLVRSLRAALARCGGQS